MNKRSEEFIKEVVKNKDSVHFEGIVKMLLTDLLNSDNPNELWRKAFDILLSKGGVYMYDYDAAIKELDEKGFSIVLVSNPKEPETVHGNEAEKEVCENCGEPIESGQQFCKECEKDDYD